MNSTFFNRRKLMTSLAAAVSAVGAGTLMTTRAQAKTRDAGVRKLGRDGKPADGKQMITALITHNGLLYIAGQGANSNGPVGKDDIDSHTTKVMENVKELVVTGGGTMDSILAAYGLSREPRLLRANEQDIQNLFSQRRAGAHDCGCSRASG